MSVTLATVADALIEFILSLLRDPEEAKKFDADPQGALAARGLQNVNAQDVCAVAPIVAERPEVVQVSQPRVVDPGSRNNDSDVVREVRTIVNNLSMVDDRDTLIDQSVNQNIWANGDVTQHFDQSAVVASGDGSIAAGGDVDIDETTDNSTTITAGEDANVGNDTDVTTNDGSYNTTTDSSQTTDASTTTTSTDSNNDTSSSTVDDGSHNSSAAEYNDVNVDEQSNTVDDSSGAVIVDDSTVDDGL